MCVCRFGLLRSASLFIRRRHLLIVRTFVSITLAVRSHIADLDGRSVDLIRVLLLACLGRELAVQLLADAFGAQAAEALQGFISGLELLGGIERGRILFDVRQDHGVDTIDLRVKISGFKVLQEFVINRVILFEIGLV